MRKLAAYTVVRLASALSWKPPPNRVKELFPATADAARRNADPDAVFVVTGASGGIGSTIVEQLHARTAGTVYACCRDPSKVSSLDRVRPIKLDVRDDASIEALPAAVGDRVDALWNVGGVLHEGERGPERSLLCANQTVRRSTRRFRTRHENLIYAQVTRRGRPRVAPDECRRELRGPDPRHEGPAESAERGPPRRCERAAGVGRRESVGARRVDLG